MYHHVTNRRNFFFQITETNTFLEPRRLTVNKEIFLGSVSWLRIWACKKNSKIKLGQKFSRANFSGKWIYLQNFPFRPRYLDMDVARTGLITPMYALQNS